MYTIFGTRIFCLKCKYTLKASYWFKFLVNNRVFSIMWNIYLGSRPISFACDITFCCNIYYSCFFTGWLLKWIMARENKMVNYCLVMVLLHYRGEEINFWRRLYINCHAIHIVCHTEYYYKKINDVSSAPSYCLIGNKLLTTDRLFFCIYTYICFIYYWLHAFV